MTPHLIQVIQAEYLGGYQARLKFSDGVTKTIDLQERLAQKSGLFEPLREVEYFQQFRLDPESGTLEWPNGVDFAPDTLYHLGV